MARTAAVLNVIVTASTGQASSRLLTLQRQLGYTAKSASSADVAAQRFTSTLKAAGLAAGVVAGASAKMAIDFDRSMRNVNSIAQLGEKQFKGLSESVLDLAGPTAQAPQTLSEGLYDLVSSGFDAKDSLTVLRSSAKAATAGLTDTATSTKAVAAVLNAYRQPASKAKEVSDILFRTVDKGVVSFEELSTTIGDTLPFASQLGVGLEEVGAATATMTKQGLSPAETMTRIRNLLQTMIKPSSDLSTAFKDLGVESGEVLIKQEGFQGALEAVIGTTSGAKDEVAKLFPNIRALGGALALTGGNSKSAAEDLKSLKDSSGATAGALEEQSKSLSYQFQQLKAEASASAIRFGQVLLPVLAKAIDAFRGISGQVGEAAKSIGEFIGGLPTPLKNAVLGLVGAGAAVKALSLLFNVALLGGITKAIAAFKVLRLAMLANPFGAVLVGVTGLAAALGAFDTGTSKAEKAMQKMGMTAFWANKGFRKMDGQLKDLANSQERVTRLSKKEEQAGKDVKTAQEELNQARQDSGPASKEALEAQRKLTRAKLKEKRVTEDLKLAERESRLERRASKPVIREALAGAKELAEQNRKGVKQAQRLYQQERASRGNDKAELQALDTLIERKGAYSKSQRKVNSILADAGERIGPKYAKSLKGLSVAELRMGVASAKRAERLGREVRLQERARDSLVRQGTTYTDAAALVDDMSGKQIQALVGLEKKGGKALDDLSRKGREKSKALRDGVVGNVNSMVDGVGSGLGTLNENTNSALKAYGAKALSFVVKKAQKSAESYAGLQRGGPIDVGAPSGDSVPALLERGEYVLNRNAVRAMGKQQLDAINFGAAKRFQKGGVAEPPGDVGSEVVQAAYAPAVGSFLSKWGMDLTQGYNPSGPSVSAGHLSLSAAPSLDVVPSNGDWGGSFLAGLKSAVAQGWNVLYGSRGVGTVIANHGEGNHAHIDWGGGTKDVGGAMGVAEKLKRILLEGPAGPLREMGQGALDKSLKAANEFIASKMPTGTSGSGAPAMSGSGDVEAAFAKVAKRLSDSKTATLALGMAGYAESGMQDLPGGHSTSQGSLQLLASTAAGMGVSPHDEQAVASLFLQRGFYGRGGANALAAQGLPAHLVAQSVQGSAFSSGSNYAAQAGPAKAWMQRYGLQEGGLVAKLAAQMPPYAGEFAKGGLPSLDKGGRVERAGVAQVHPGDVHVGTGSPKIEVNVEIRGDVIPHKGVTRDEVIQITYAAIDGEQGHIERHVRQMAGHRR